MSAGAPQVVPLERGGAAAARSALERTIAAGGVAVFPSDGVYGLACDPLDAGAIARIHRMKGRDDGKPAAVMYFSPLAMRELVAELGPRAAAAVSALLPGPVTLVVKNPGHRYPLDPGQILPHLDLAETRVAEQFGDLRRLALADLDRDRRGGVERGRLIAEGRP